jgi:hypothetical protein
MSHRQARAEQGPVKVADQHRTTGWYTRGNAWLAVRITNMVGTMTCAWLFAAWAVYGLPVALRPGGIGFANWFAEEFLQLVLLSVIMVGQNVQATAADKRSEQTYNDVEMLLLELDEIKALLAARTGSAVNSGESNDSHGTAGDLRRAEPAGYDRDPDSHGKAGAPEGPEGYGAGPRPVA